MSPRPEPDPSEGPVEVSRRYIAVLGGIAALLLTGGLLARHALEAPDAASTAPPSQATALQQLSHASQLRRTADFLAERIGAASASVTFVAAAQASGLRWRGDTVLTSDRGHVLRPITTTSPDSMHHAITLAPDTVSRDWLMIVARDSSARVISATLLAGGRASTRCGGLSMESFVFGVPLDERLSGGGIFTVEGELAGMTVWCDGMVVGLPVRELQRLIASTASPRTLESPLGFALAGADSDAQRFVGSDSTALVTAVQRGSVADDAGLRVGDLLLAVDGSPLPPVSERAQLAGLDAESLTVLRRRGATIAPVTLRMTPSAAADNQLDGYGIVVRSTPSPAGVPIAEVIAGSVAAEAGLQRGDRLLRVNDSDVSSVAAAARLLDRTGPADSTRRRLVVFERDGVERGVLLPLAPRDARAAPPR